MKQILMLFILFFASGFAGDGFALKYEEIGRLNLPDGFPSVYYRLLPQGLDEGADYTLYLERISGKKEVLGKYKAVKGVLVSDKGVDIRNDVQMAAYYCPGEPFLFVLSGKHEESLAQVVPQPISVLSQDGARASLNLTKSDGVNFFCAGEGFMPNERVRIRTFSGKKVTEDVQIATDAGGISFPLNPAVKKKKSGKCTLEFIRKHETLVLKFAWGKEALEKITASINDIPTEDVRKSALDQILKPYTLH